jgi:rare lipoprotein A
MFRDWASIIFLFSGNMVDNMVMKRISLFLTAALLTAVTGGAQNYPPADLSNFRQEGIASWYGTEFDGRPTASGEIFNSSLYTAAHPTLPFGTILGITNLNNGRKVNVKVNDRGPFVSSRIIDLSQAAAQMLDMITAGTAPVLVEVLNGGQSGTPAYWAESDSYARSDGGNSTATAQITAPPYPVYQAPQDPAYIQAQPPQQQITQYFQQPPMQPPPASISQQPRQQVLPPIQQVQPVQQVLPVIQPVQPVVQVVPQAAPQTQPVQQQPAQPAAVQPQQPVQPVPQQLPPVQIQIPIEVKPVVSTETVQIREDPRAPEARPAAAVKPNRIYRVQVGSYREARNALAAFERLKGAGLSPVYERNGDLFRVVLAGIPSGEVNGVLQKIRTAGFTDSLLREER